MANSKFIVIDGIEGAGKSTQLEKLKEQWGDAVVFTREPGGSPYAEEIRNVILKSPNASQADAITHFNLFWAARADHLKNTIIPALEAGKHVICDRFDSSTFAYQIYGKEQKELLELFDPMRKFVLRNVKPDMYILLDVEIETGLARKQKQSAEGKTDLNHFDHAALSFHRRMKEGFYEFMKKEPNHKVVDASKSFDEVNVELNKILKEVIK